MLKDRKVTCFNKFVKTLNNWKDKIVNFATLQISNAATEGLNNIARLVKRFSFGLPQFTNFRLRVLARFAT